MADGYNPGAIWQHKVTKEPVVIKYTTGATSSTVPSYVCFNRPNGSQANFNQFEFYRQYELVSLAAEPSGLTAWDYIAKDEAITAPYRIEGPFLVFGLTYLLAEKITAFQASFGIIGLEITTAIFLNGMTTQCTVDLPVEIVAKAYLEWWSQKSGV